jgi:hypothetical protein
MLAREITGNDHVLAGMPLQMKISAKAMKCAAPQ